MVFATVFVINPHLANGIVSGKYFWFYSSIIPVAIAALLSYILNKRADFRWSPIDRLVLWYAVSVAILVPGLDGILQKQIILPLIICLYFCFRFFLTSIRPARFYLSLFFVCTGLIESCIGLAQLYGWEISHHSLFRITGTFFNPGPYSGYVAMVAPMALYYAISDRKILKLKFDRRLLPFIIRWSIGTATIVVSLLILPASMSRIAWLGLLAGSGLVMSILLFRQKKYKEYLIIHKKRVIIILCSMVVCLLIALIGMYHLKKDSADGRALMWKISMSVVPDHLQGSGLGSFPAVYGEAQANYFEEGKGTEIEERVAGNPEYAFNEYLQICIEQGVIPVAFFLMILAFAIYYGIKKKNIAATGSLVSLAVFAFASYPFSVLPFLIGLAYLLALISTSAGEGEIRNEVGKPQKWKRLFIWTPLIAGIVLISAYCVYIIYPSKAGYESWNKSKILYQSGVYDEALKKYKEIYPFLRDQIPFLFEYAQSLSKSGQYETSNEVLKDGMQISCDPMLYNIMGKNYQSLKQYPEAEKCFLKAAYIVPNRMYPYYLLTKMYLESGQQKKAEDMASIVLTKEPKVHSTAVEEMRREIKKMIDK